MQSLSGFARKYSIMEELDGGFSSGSTPEAFVRLDSWEGRIQVSLHAKGLKQGPYAYKLYLIFASNEKLVPILAGSMTPSYNGVQTGLEIDAETMRNNGLKPESVRFVAITAESRDRMWIPLFSSFEKNYKWDESIRQLLLKKTEPEPEKNEPGQTKKTDEGGVQAQQPGMVQNRDKPEEAPEKAQRTAAGLPNENMDPDAALQTQDHQTIEQTSDDQCTASQTPGHQTMGQTSDHQGMTPPTAGKQTMDTPASGKRRQAKQDNYKCDINKLEGFLHNNFEIYTPFKRASRSYTWYRVSDLAKLSNIMYMSGINVPVFANPKILVGLFKFKHILAGLYHGDNGSSYYCIGVPAKDENDNRPFESACRWVPVSESPVRDMGGYWLVYVSLRTGEIVV